MEGCQQAIERLCPTSGNLEAGGEANYCQVVKYNGTAYIAGQTATDMSEGRSSSYEAQITQVLTLLEQHLATAGTTKSNLLSVRVFLKDIKIGGAVFNELWRIWLGPPETAALPTCTTIQADLFDPAYLVEVDAVAAVPTTAARLHTQQDAAIVPGPAQGVLRLHKPGRAGSWRPGAWATAVQGLMTNGYVLTFAFLAVVAPARVRPRRR